MHRSRALRPAVALALAGALSLSIASALHPLTARAAGTTMTASPATNLVDGQFVKLTLNGFAPNIGVPFRQCIANPVSAATDCTPISTQVFAITDAAGAGIIFVPVYAGTDSALTNAGGSGAITCDASHPCVIAGVTTTTDLTNAVFAPISFAPATDSCPDPGASAVFGSGSATAYRAMYAWQATVCVPPYNLPMIYAVSNSVDGIGNFGLGQQQANYGVTGPVPPFTLPSSAPSFAYAPITASAVVLAYKIFDRRGQQVTDLTLTPWLIAQIYEGNIADFDVDPDVKFLNPNTQFPGRVVPYARAEHSAETYVFTSWLSNALGPGSWPAGAQAVFPQPPTGVTNISGSRSLGFAVANPLTSWFDQGNMGFMDSSTAAYYGLPTVSIRMPSGAVVAATPSSIAKGLSLATANADGTYTPNYSPSDPTAYPMSIPSYMLAPTNQIAPTEGKTLAAFLRYAVQAGQSNLPSGYVQLPAAMVNQSLKVADQIPQTIPAPTSNPTAAPTQSGYSGGGGSALGFVGHGYQSPALTSPTTAGAPSSATTPCSNASPSATPAPAASPAAASPTASPASYASPGTSPSAVPTSPRATPCPATTTDSGGGRSATIALSGDVASRYVLPSVVIAAMVGLVVGPLGQWLTRRRRARAPRAQSVTAAPSSVVGT